MQYLCGDSAGYSQDRRAAGTHLAEANMPDMAGNDGTVAQIRRWNKHPAYKRGNGGSDCGKRWYNKGVG